MIGIILISYLLIFFGLLTTLTGAFLWKFRPEHRWKTVLGTGIGMFLLGLLLIGIFLTGFQ